MFERAARSGRIMKASVECKMKNIETVHMSMDGRFGACECDSLTFPLFFSLPDT